MLYVKTEIRPSPIHGLGLYAAESIAKGALVFRWKPTFGWTCSATAFELLPEGAQAFVKKYGWRWVHPDFPAYVHSTWRLDVDDSRFVNHSREPNMVVTTSGLPWRNSDHAIEARAGRDIFAGEELTEDYGTFDPDFENYKDILNGAARYDK